MVAYIGKEAAKSADELWMLEGYFDNVLAVRLIALLVLPSYKPQGQIFVRCRILGKKTGACGAVPCGFPSSASERHYRNAPAREMPELEPPFEVLLDSAHVRVANSPMMMMAFVTGAELARSLCLAGRNLTRMNCTRLLYDIVPRLDTLRLMRVNGLGTPVDLIKLGENSVKKQQVRESSRAMVHLGDPVALGEADVANQTVNTIEANLAKRRRITGKKRIAAGQQEHMVSICYFVCLPLPLSCLSLLSPLSPLASLLTPLSPLSLSLSPTFL